MSDDDDSVSVKTLVICQVIAGATGIMVGFAIAGALWTADAIKHSAARFDPQTGAFTWNEGERKP